jgi:hypothetical protein
MPQSTKLKFQDAFLTVGQDHARDRADAHLTCSDSVGCYRLRGRDDGAAE